MGGASNPIDALIAFCLRWKIVVAILVLMAVGWGITAAPFAWNLGGLPRDPVPVDAIPDIGENQQIVFTEWPGRSPQDVEDQVTYPLTVSLLGVPGVRTVRSYSMFGFSSIYVIFEEDVEFYWSRSRILERLNSLPPGTVPEDVQPALGPDATGLGQVFWYTLEGRDPEGNPTGGWDLSELRSIQDWHVRYALASADGVSEVASVGGFEQEYQVDVDPDAMRAYGVTLEEVYAAVRMSNLDVGARTVEVNRVEYVIRGVGFVKSLQDLERSVVAARGHTPVYLGNVAHVTLGPAMRRGVLDKEGTEAVGGVVTVRYGENPLQAIANVKARIAEIAPGLPRKTLADGTVSQVAVVPFYDRTDLIHETLGTLRVALRDEILVTIIVVLMMVMHLRSSILISGLLPLAVLMCFIAMRWFGVDANLVALSGIAIAIGTMVDMGIVVCENILRHLEQNRGDPPARVVFRAASEVGGAVVTAVATTVVGFLPVFAMTGAEGKLFQPLAYTKTFALVASVLIAVLVLPPAAQLLFPRRSWLPPRFTRWLNWTLAAVVLVFLTAHWLPLGPGRGLVKNLIFTTVLIGGLLLAFHVYRAAYPRLLAVALRNKTWFLAGPALVALLGFLIWQGFDRCFGWLPRAVLVSPPVSAVAHTFPGLGKEFMPPLDEGSFLFMPTTMPHASIGEAQDVLAKQDMALYRIPEVVSAVGKLGRAESPLDPAPVSMIETVVTYYPEYLADADGSLPRFRYDAGKEDWFRDLDGEPVPAPDGEPYRVRGAFVRDASGALIPDRRGRPFRVWRGPLDPALNPGREAWSGVQSPEDIWDRIAAVTQIPGTTGAPRLQPIAARLVMLQSGMRAPMGVKVKGQSLEQIEAFGYELERLLKEVPSIQPDAVVADRIVGKPYLEIHIDREAIAHYGIRLTEVQDVIEVALGGKPVTRTVEGRERYAVRVRYLRELRDNVDSIRRILVAAADGTQIPLGQLARIEYARGPQMIKSEDTFLVGYVIFDRKPGFAEVDVVEDARDFLAAKTASGELAIPPGVSYEFAGNWENQVRAQKKLAVILPLALAVIFLILYFQFGSVSTTTLVFSGIAVAWGGGFILLWLYGQSWFMDFSVFGTPVREMFQMGPMNLSVAVWVGFLALFGIATDDGVIMATYLKQTFDARTPDSVESVRAAVVEAGTRRIRPCLMTVATTILALLPVLTSTGRGSDIMVPMAIPSFGGMAFVVLTTFTVPVLYSALAERRVRRSGGEVVS